MKQYNLDEQYTSRPGVYGGDAETLAAIKKALEKAGVEFINGKRPGR